MKAIDVILNRKTIRKFDETPITDEMIVKIVEAGIRAPSACSLQTYSIIWIKEKERRKKLWESCGKQSWILDAPLTLCVCSDVRKISRMMGALDFESSLEEGMGYRWKLFSLIDAALVAQNMVIASESFGLGSVYIGGAMANRKVIEALNLPRGVLPISLLCIGYPSENPPLRPRHPLENILFIDKYRDLTIKELENSIRCMTEKLVKEQYYVNYEMGDRNYTWIDNVKSKMVPDRESEERLIKLLKQAGFTFSESIP